jgi:hypothetical protein
VLRDRRTTGAKQLAGRSDEGGLAWDLAGGSTYAKVQSNPLEWELCSNKRWSAS